VFSLLPPAPLLTFGLHAPAAWMVQAVSAEHDLDNIHLEAAPAGVTSVFELECGSFLQCVYIYKILLTLGLLRVGTC
jgi:hypothetical protein